MFSEKKWHCHENLIVYSYMFQIPFGSDILSSCIPFSIKRKEISVKKTYTKIFGIYEDRNNCVWIFLYVLLIIVRGKNTSLSLLINLYYIPFLWIFFYLTVFHSVLILNRIISSVSVILLHMFLNSHLW